MPGGAVGELRLLQQHHVALPRPDEMKGDAGADDAAADDDDPRVGRERLFAHVPEPPRRRLTRRSRCGRSDVSPCRPNPPEAPNPRRPGRRNGRGRGRRSRRRGQRCWDWRGCPAPGSLPAGGWSTPLPPPIARAACGRRAPAGTWRRPCARGFAGCPANIPAGPVALISSRATLSLVKPKPRRTRLTISAISSSITAWPKSNDISASSSPPMTMKLTPESAPISGDIPFSKPAWASLTLALVSPR